MLEGQAHAVVHRAQLATEPRERRSSPEGRLAGAVILQAWREMLTREVPFRVKVRAYRWLVGHEPDAALPAAHACEWVGMDPAALAHAAHIAWREVCIARNEDGRAYPRRVRG